MRLFVLPHSTGCASARDLAASLGCRRLRLQDSRYTPRGTDVIINWGHRTPDEYARGTARVVNANAFTSSKLASLMLFSQSDVPTVPFTTTRNTAKDWLEEGSTVVVRTMLNASSGRGIELLVPDHDGTPSVPPAPLYTKYVKKRDEYRVHVLGGEVISTQIKLTRTGSEGNDYRIRSYDNGFIFGREAVAPSGVRDRLAVAALEALGLQFGAVDIIYNAYHDQYYVLEVNTAPGMQGETVNLYTTAIRSYLENM